jgi:hypothetical protein
MHVYPWANENGSQESGIESWLSAPTTDARSIASLMHERTKQRINNGQFSDHDVAYINALQVGTAKSAISLNGEQLEKLRQLCQLWDIALHPRQIESHRPFVGPVIVKVKRLVFRLLQVLLKDLIRQQRAFNAATIASFLAFAEQPAEITKQECTSKKMG